MISEESLLDLMRDAPHRWTTFEADYVHWWHNGRLLEAADHHTRGWMSRNGRPRVPSPPSAEARSHVWFNGWSKQRVERPATSTEPRLLTIYDGDRWYLDQRGEPPVRGNNGELSPPDIEALLDPGRLVPRLHVLEISPGTIDGRACWLVDASVTAMPDLMPSWPPSLMAANEGDHYRLHIDQERGVALRMEARWRNKPSSIRHATSVVFDAPLDPALFDI